MRKTLQEKDAVNVEVNKSGVTDRVYVAVVLASIVAWPSVDTKDAAYNSDIFINTVVSGSPTLPGTAKNSLIL